MRLSATYHPILFLIKKLKEIYPTATAIGCVFYDNDETVFISNNERIALSVVDKVNVNQLRGSKFSTRWIDDTFLFDNKAWHSGGQKNIIDETENRCLLVRLETDKPLKDLIFISFPKQISLFNKWNDFESITSSEKHLLAELIFQSLTFDFKQLLKEQNALRNISKIQQQQYSDKQKLKNDYVQLEQIYLETVEALILKDLKDKENELNVEFIVTSKFLSALAHKKLSALELKNTLIHAIDLAFTINFGRSKIELLPEYIQIDEKEERYSAVQDKAEQLLNNYEKSAQKCLAFGLKINGKNIASHLEHPVSPPAINFAISSNEKRIQYLLRNYPEKWSLIKSGLKTLQKFEFKNSRIA